jgi:glutathione-regulated potassium-efflux system protein KefB
MDVAWRTMHNGMLATTDNQLVQAVALLGAAVVVVPLFRRLGLGSVLGYLAAGLLVGPHGLGWFSDADAILNLAQMGIVMFLFVIGLEMRPSQLLVLGKTMLHLGVLQIATCAVAMTAVTMLFGLPLETAFIAAMGCVLTSTAIVTQQLSERRELEQKSGQRIVSVLIMEDLLVVPLLAALAWMSPRHVDAGWLAQLGSILRGLAALAVLVAAGRWLLNPFFRILAQTKVREVLSAGALLVVLGSALLMEMGGLSMATGAFLAGVLLSESSFRHQIEADIEPFRGVLLGLFFLGVGMALDTTTVQAHLGTILGLVVALVLTKGLSIYVVGRIRHCDPVESANRAGLMALGGEFAFVLYANAASFGVITPDINAWFTAVVVLTMALSPLPPLLVRRFGPGRAAPVTAPPPAASGLSGSVLMIGFGRFGQVVSQSLLARDVDVTVIDTDIEMIQAAADFGFKIYYGDGTRLDVIEAAGAGKAHVIAICTDRRETTDAIVELALAAFSQATLHVRSFDREHSLHLESLGVHHHMRETFESALAFGSHTLRSLGATDAEADAVSSDVRRRDAERFTRELSGVGWAAAGLTSFRKRTLPAPLTEPKRKGEALNKVAEAAKDAADSAGGS